MGGRRPRRSGDCRTGGLGPPRRGLRTGEPPATLMLLLLPRVVPVAAARKAKKKWRKDSPWVKPSPEAKRARASGGPRATRVGRPSALGSPPQPPPPERACTPTLRMPRVQAPVSCTLLSLSLSGVNGVPRAPPGPSEYMEVPLGVPGAAQRGGPSPNTLVIANCRLPG